MARSGGWFQTYTGRQYWLTDPHPDDVDITDIAHALSNTCRFGGHTREFYSVGQHVVHVVQYLRERFPLDFELQLDGLFHDASEAYLGDVVRPLKKTMQQYLDCEKQTMAVIYQGLKLAPPRTTSHIFVKQADNALLMAERRDLIHHRDIPWAETQAPWHHRIVPWTPRIAEDAFMREYFSLRERVASTR